MAWYYTTPRPQRRPLDPPPGRTTDGGGGPPTGPAGGDLTGAYPNPTIAAGAVGNAEISDVAYTKVTGAPTSLPPSGAASGDLAGTYPAPTIGAGKVTNTAVATGIDAAKISTGTLPVAQVPNLDAAKITTGTLVQARLPVSPTGLLTANLNDGQVTDAKIAGVAYSKVTGAPTALPPSGAAGGDLAGTYPAPTIGAATVTRAKTASDCWLPPVPVAGDVGKLLTVTTGPALAWQAGGGGPPTGAAGGDLAGTYPNPDIKALAVGTPALADGAVTNVKVTDVAYSKVTGAPTTLPPSGAAGGDLAGSTYPNPLLKVGGALHVGQTVALPVNFSNATTGAWLTVATLPAIAVRGSWVVLVVAPGGVITCTSGGGTVYYAIFRGVTQIAQFRFDIQMTGALTVPAQPLVMFDVNPPAGTYVYTFQVHQVSTARFQTLADSPGRFYAAEFA
jgi:hypothetical protein